MRPSGVPRRGRPLWATLGVGFGVLLVGAVGTVGGLIGSGLMQNPFAAKAPQGLPPGMVAVLITTRPIAAHTKVTREDVWDTKRGQFATVPLREDEIAPGMLAHLGQFNGRVLKRDKPAGYAFNESDFHPKGTREGIVAGIPPGKRAVVLDASKLNGVHGLHVGDHVDILSSQTLDMQKGLGRNAGGAAGAMFAAQKQASTRVLVQDGVIVTPVTTRAKPISSSSLLQGAQSKTVPMQEVVIAVTPEEVAPLYSAAAVESQLTCVARSGQPDEAPAEVEATAGAAPKPAPVTPGKVASKPESESAASKPPKPAASTSPKKVTQAGYHTPSDDPLSRMTLIEGVIGSKRAEAKRQMLVFPEAGRAPVDLNRPATPPASTAGI